MELLVKAEGLLLPIEYQVSEEIQAIIMLAVSYQGAGMTLKANRVYANAVIKICKINKMPILSVRGQTTYISNGGWIKTYHGLNGGNIRDERSWDVRPISKSSSDVPEEVLTRMINLTEEHRTRLYIAEKQVDPILLYKLPYLEDKFIELAQWD